MNTLTTCDLQVWNRRVMDATDQNHFSNDTWVIVDDPDSRSIWPAAPLSPVSPNIWDVQHNTQKKPREGNDSSGNEKRSNGPQCHRSEEDTEAQFPPGALWYESPASGH